MIKKQSFSGKIQIQETSNILNNFFFLKNIDYARVSKVQTTFFSFSIKFYKINFQGDKQHIVLSKFALIIYTEEKVFSPWKNNMNEILLEH